MKQTAYLNQLWSESIVKEFIHNQVRYFCMGFGSRNTPLVLSIAKHPLAKTMTHFDERGAAFHALGYAKASGLPAAVVVTSGSAVANLYPAVMEAYEEGIPLILLTADRPWELRDVGANQTTDQVKIFDAHVHWQMDFPPPEPGLSLEYLRSTISSAVQRSKHAPGGPVHLNFMFREPFCDFDDGAEKIAIKSCPSKTHYIKLHPHLDEKEIEYFAGELFRHKEGIILVGGLEANAAIEPIIQLGKNQGWPILADITSNIRSEGVTGEIIPYYDLLVREKGKTLKPKAILHLGNRYVSKALLQWISSLELEMYMHVASHQRRIDPTSIVTHRIQFDPSSFCRTMNDFYSFDSDADYVNSWIHYSKQAEEQIKRFMQTHGELNELSIPSSLISCLDETTAVFFANSMPIRDADALFFPRKNTGPVFANRGVSGIDGNIATAIGISAALDRPMIAVLGDLAFLHDLNSLAQMQMAENPIIFVVVNNAGGGIFSFLPVAEGQKETFEKYFAGNHHFEFKEIAAFFRLSYHKPNSVEAFETAIKNSKSNEKSAIIEVQTNREENYQLHLELAEIIKKVEPKKRSFLSLCYSAFAKGT